ncbi:MAG: branched-chain amino acid ABC transporter ATP-binding protein/permease [Bradyrhizobium sp.]
MTRGTPRTVYAAVAAFAVVYLVLIAVTRNSYYQLTLTLVPIWAMMGLSWNILSGYSGLISFGHAAFFGIGAYATTLLFTLGNVTPWLGIPCATLLGALAALLVGGITFRLRGHYFALAMLAYPLAMLHLFEWAGYNEVSLPMKRENAAAFMQFADQRVYAVIALGLMILIMLLSVRIERSRFGMSLLAIKQNEIAAEATGIDSLKWKLRAIAVSGAIAGLAGGFYAIVLLVVTPETVFGMATSAQALIVTMFGGVGTVWGPVIGASILVPLSEFLHAQLGSRVPGIQGVVYGLAIMLVISRMPQGIFWKLTDLGVTRQPRPPSMTNRGERYQSQPPLIGGDILTVQHVSRSFGGVRALVDVSMAVRSGEILGIIGPNGAGKTTLFNLLNGLVSPGSGHVRFLERDLLGLSASAVCALGIGRTFQVTRPFARMSVLENVVVGAFVSTSTDHEAIAAARAALERVGLAQLADVAAGELTNYELRLMELARAISASPKLLLLDEPLAGLAGTESDAFVNLVRRLRDGGLTVVIIEHTVEAMRDLVDRMIVLDHGTVIAEGEPRKVLRDSQVIKAYLGDKWAANAEA